MDQEEAVMQQFKDILDSLAELEEKCVSSDMLTSIDEAYISVCAARLEYIAATTE